MWTLSFDFSTDLSGASCNDIGQSAFVFVDVEGVFLNVTNGGTPIKGASYSAYHILRTSGSASATYSFQHNLTWGAILGTSDTYEIAAVLLLEVTVVVNNGYSGDMDACTATASVSDTSAKNLAVLNGVGLIHY
ncbi:MAG TPA: hypothetical protein VFF67_06300 [Thermoplasmata archaeon]|nr:hypothetical protein [Thermoplasmata archaeon]